MDYDDEVRRLERELSDINRRIDEANASGLDGRKIFENQKSNICGALSNARDLARG